MNQPTEIFRVLVGLTDRPREIDAESARITRIQSAIFQILRPLSVDDRIHFLLDSSQSENKQWLVVCIRPSRQLSLFTEISDMLATASLQNNPENQNAYRLMVEAFHYLQILSQAARWTPDQFFELIQRVPVDQNLAPVRRLAFNDDAAELRGPDGYTRRVQIPIGPRRHTIQQDVPIQFDVVMVGQTEAVVTPPKSARRQLKIKDRRVSLYWLPQRLPHAMSKLERVRDTATKLANATVRLTVDRNGNVKALELCRLDDD